MNATVEFSVVDCPNCGIQFAITGSYERRRRADHVNFYCPSGHAQHYPGQTDEDRLRKLAIERSDRIVALQNERAELQRRLSRKRKK